MITQMKRALDRAYDILMRVRSGKPLTMREAFITLAKNTVDARSEILLGLSYHRFPDGITASGVEEETQPVGVAPAME
jgi:hypothetical protein